MQMYRKPKHYTFLTSESHTCVLAFTELLSYTREREREREREKTLYLHWLCGGVDPFWRK